MIGIKYFLLFAYTSSDEERPQLEELVSSLLNDREPLVLSAAMFAFQTICPDKFDLLHPNFRKYCHLLADIDEWGQVTILGVLTRYACTFFASPFQVFFVQI